MATKNDVTGQELVTKAATNLYREGYDRIFGKKEKVTAPYVEPPDEDGPGVGWTPPEDYGNDGPSV
jgi:hypothetical protein